jgi:hypothetical protein
LPVEPVKNKNSPSNEGGAVFFIQKLSKWERHFAAIKNDRAADDG